MTTATTIYRIESRSHRCDECGEICRYEQGAPTGDGTAEAVPWCPAHPRAGYYSDPWEPDAGEENRFGSREEAEAAIEDLRKLGNEWASAEYRVTEVWPRNWPDTYYMAWVEGIAVSGGCEFSEAMKVAKDVARARGETVSIYRYDHDNDHGGTECFAVEPGGTVEEL